MQPDGVSDSDADSLYVVDECAPPSGPPPPFGTVLVGEVAAKLDELLDIADEEPLADDSPADSDDSDGLSASSSSSYPESESSLDNVSIEDVDVANKDFPAKLAPPPDFSTVSLAKPSRDGDNPDLANASSSSEDEGAGDNDDAPPVRARPRAQRPRTVRLQTSHVTRSASSSESESESGRAPSDAASPVDSDDELFGVDSHVDDDGVDDDDDDDSLSEETPPTSTEVFSDKPSLSDNSSAHGTPLRKDSDESKSSQESKSSDASSKKSTAGFFFRAATFYKAFKKPPKPKDTKPASGSDPSRSPPRADDVPPPVAPLSPEEALAREKEEDTAHLKLEHHLSAQIATLRSAQSGFVDLALLKPMTQSTLAAIGGEARRILEALPDVERRKEEVERRSQALHTTTEAELANKEQLLVAAKLRLCEARGEVQTLKHNLYLAQKKINHPDRIAAKERYTLSVRKQKAERELGAAKESMETMERNLMQRQKSLQRDTAEVKRLENSYRDLQGDWA